MFITSYYFTSRLELISNPSQGFKTTLDNDRTIARVDFLDIPEMSPYNLGFVVILNNRDFFSHKKQEKEPEIR